MRKFIRHFSVIAALIVCAANDYGLAQPIRPNKANFLLYWANKLQQNINPQNTEYRHKDDMISWGDDGITFQCYTDCSGFINALIARAYHLKEENFKAELGHKRMYACHYYDAIAAGRGFQQIKNIRRIIPGDIIAIRYTDRDEHEDNTGHVMLIASLPRIQLPTKVLEPNTTQYEVDVIDCSKKPHGKSDTRFTPEGLEYSGLGRGEFRLYTDEQGNIVAYSWSTGNPKEGFEPFENPIAVGRFLTHIYF
jgi:hypothetical protein